MVSEYVVRLWVKMTAGTAKAKLKRVIVKNIGREDTRLWNEK